MRKDQEIAELAEIESCAIVVRKSMPADFILRAMAKHAPLQDKDLTWLTAAEIIKLSEVTVKNRSSLFSNLQALINIGLIEAKTKPDDSRIRRYSISEKGLQCAKCLNLVYENDSTKTKKDEWKSEDKRTLLSLQFQLAKIGALVSQSRSTIQEFTEELSELREFAKNELKEELT